MNIKLPLIVALAQCLAAPTSSLFAQNNSADDAVVPEVTVQTHNSPFPAPNQEQADEDRKLFTQLQAGHGIKMPDFFFDYATAQNHAPSHSIIIRTSSADEKSTRSLKEDLAIMNRLIEKNLPEGLDRGSGRAAGIDLFVFKNKSNRTLYIEDYGAIFFINVGIPLIAPSKPEKKKEKQTEVEDSAWEETKNELNGRKHQTTVVWKDRHSRNKREFDQSLVDQLQDALLKSLRSASNIRALKPDEYVTIVVNSQTGGGENHATIVADNGDDASYLGSQGPGTIDEDIDSATMVIRAKKSLIEEYAKNKDEDAFRKKASIAIY